MAESLDIRALRTVLLILFLLRRNETRSVNDN